MIYNRRNFLKRFLTFGAATLSSVSANVRPVSTIKLTTIKAAGLQYGECVDFLFFPNEPLKLIREPQNRYDRYAVAIYKEDKKLGYVPKANSRIIASLMDKGTILSATVRYYDQKKEPWERVWVSVWMANS